MAKNFELTEELNANIGWLSMAWIFEVTSTSVRAFARGVGYTDPVYFDVDAAKAAGYQNLPAPSTYLGTAVFVPGQNHDDLSVPPGFFPDIGHGLPNLLDGGTQTDYMESICAGDTLTAVVQLTELVTKESKGLGTMLIMTTETTYKNQSGKVVAIQKSQSIFY